MAKTTISLNIPKSAAERAARSVLFDILGQYRVGDINHEQAAEAIEHWRTSVNASLEGDAVERVARIIDPQAWRDRDHYDDYRRLPASEHHATKSSITKARAILATGLVAGEAAIRADEREKCAKVADEHSFGRDIDWWLRATKKDVSAETCRSIAAAIRSGGAK